MKRLFNSETVIASEEVATSVLRQSRVAILPRVHHKGTSRGRSPVSLDRGRRRVGSRGSEVAVTNTPWRVGLNAAMNCRFDTCKRGSCKEH